MPWEAHEMSRNIVALLGETKDSLCTASAISAACAEAYNDAVDDMGAAADKAATSMEAMCIDAHEVRGAVFLSCGHTWQAMLSECAKLEATFDNMDLTAARLKELRGEVDQLEYLLRRSPKLARAHQ
jgi:hypothetical protein